MINSIASIATALNTTRRYFEVKTAYNIDRFRFQSMVSTAHKLLTLSDAIRRDGDEQAVALAESVSHHWFTKTLGSSLFAEHKEAFLAVQSWIYASGHQFDVSENQYATDEYCQYILVLPPATTTPKILNMTNSEMALPDFVRSEMHKKANGVLQIGKQRLPIFDFTRRECGLPYNIVSGYWPTV
ncbi:hypothetical protein pSALSNUABM04_187 [Salmonella phage pSal-SNUABM-04]|nr:hypothetical protein pSALSNUABM04_187 [Salmonella phage pSal-SNUABM-04]